MKKTIYLSFSCVALLQAASFDLGTIDVNATVDRELIKNIHGEDIKSADLAEALQKQSASVSLVRRSGIANDIIVRGQKKDNINVTIDGTKVCGACPNRMDPPVSHVLTNNIDYIEIKEGPYAVDEFGALSANVKIHTIKPEEDFHGDLNLGLGSWGYQKAAFTLGGGNENIRFLLSGSTEKSEQYEDGDGNDFVGQIAREISDGVAPGATQFQPVYQGMDAYEKKTVMAKLFWDITEDQELKLSYTANRSDNILYPSSKMDAIYDDSDIYNLEYTIKNIGKFSKNLSLQFYQTEVEHPMSTKYRVKASIDTDPDKEGIQSKEMTHALTTQVNGAKIKNSFNIGRHDITIGIDYSKRNWDGGYYVNGIPLPESLFHSIYDVDTENNALFASDKIKINKQFTLDIGLRYDNTDITSKNTTQASNDYEEINGYILGTYTPDDTTKFFVGLGRSSRVPDAKELYWISSPMTMPDGTTKEISIGTPDLEDTINYEFDIGLEKRFKNSTIKAKAFYSKLDNFIAYNATKMMNKYENVDAEIYGFELSGTYIMNDAIYFDFGMAYQYGEKDTPLTGETGTNMPEIPPFKYNVALNYDWDEALSLRAEIVGASKWSDYDQENGEQEIDSYAILNLKAVKQFGNNFEITAGIDNVFDKTYAVSNTYKDLTLLTTGGENNIMLMNEPGRYIYANISYKF